MKTLGFCLLAVGLAVGAYALTMNTTISTPIGPVHNLSLSSNRQALLIVGGVLAIVGSIFAAVASRKPADTRTLDSEMVDSLNRAIARGDTRTVKKLLTDSVDVTEENEWGLSPLEAAKQHARGEILELLRAHQASRALPKA